jgi:DNA polymerase III delta prime subunit
MSKAPETRAGETLNITMRPREFEEVIGLENEVAVIKNVIDSGNIPRAFVLKGPFGCGKTTLALIIAKYVQGWDFTGSPVIEEVNSANVTGIDAMRALIRDSGNYPMVGKYRIIILDEAHKLSKAAQESLLVEFERKGNCPTIWIVCTTDPEKLIEGIRAGRCFTISLKGMDDAARAELVKRAAEKVAHEGSLDEFLAALKKSKIVSPRKILMAFQQYHSGMSVADALASMHAEFVPEYFEVVMGVVFGQWDKPFILPWITENGKPKQFKPVADQLSALDAASKKKPKKEETSVGAEDGSDVDNVEEDDVQGRPEIARALRNMVAASLKNQVYKGGAKANKATTALFKLAHCTSPNAFDAGMEFAATVGGLFSVNQVMAGKG